MYACVDMCVCMFLDVVALALASLLVCEVARDVMLLCTLACQSTSLLLLLLLSLLLSSPPPIILAAAAA